MGIADSDDSEVADFLLRVATLVTLTVAACSTVAGVAALVLPWWGEDSDYGSATLWSPRLVGDVVGMVKAIQALMVLLPIFAIGAAAAVYSSRKMSKLLLLPAALLSLASGCCGGLGIILRLNTGIKFMGTGLFSCAAATVLAGLSTVGSLYAAAIAMPRDSLDGSDDDKSTRQARAEAARVRAQEQAAELESHLRRVRRTAPQAPSLPLSPGRQMTARSDRSGGAAGSDASGSVAGPRKVPAILRQVLFWSQEEGGEEDVPTALLELAFQEIDEDGSGSIDLDELVESLRLCGLNASQAAADAIMKEIDKNASGDVDIHEFVEFFRTIEEMNKFQKKTEQRAQFLAVFCNTCFLLLIVIDGVLLMMFLKMDQAAGGDNYTIMKNLLIACSCVVGVLFLCVVAIPAMRLTLGPNVNVWAKHFVVALAERQAKRKHNKDDDDLAAGGVGLRQTAWGSSGMRRGDGDTLPPTVNAALCGASYRVRKAMLTQPSAFDVQAVTNFQGEETLGPPSKTYREPPAVTTLPGVIFDLNGEFERYDPAAYRSAALKAMDSRMPGHFNPMQGNNIVPPEDEPIPVLALTSGSFFP